MAMGKRRREEQGALWIAASELPRSGGHPFYLQVNKILDAAGFDRFVEARCRGFYADKMGRPSLPPAMYFRMLLIGYFEGIDSERGIAWRLADSLGLRRFETVALLVRILEAAWASWPMFSLDAERREDRSWTAQVSTLRIRQRVLRGWRIFPRPGSSGGAGITGGGVVRSAERGLVALERPSGSCTTWAMRAAAGPWTFT
jgi:hypothetical protein